MTAPAPSLEQVIGGEVRRLREAAGVGQAAIAAAARARGLPWSRATIAAIELGRKRLTLGEITLLVVALDAAGVTESVLGLGDLLPEDPDGRRLVTLAPAGVTLPLQEARAVLMGSDEADWTPDLKHLTIATDRRALEAKGDAEQAAAAALRVSPEAIVEASYQRWGRGLTTERDRRVRNYTTPMLKLDPAEAIKPGWPRRLQAIRGHVTRELLEELQTVKTMTRKATTKRKAKR